MKKVTNVGCFWTAIRRERERQPWQNVTFAMKKLASTSAQLAVADLVVRNASSFTKTQGLALVNATKQLTFHLMTTVTVL
jgi:hypothetical protein